jgi:hypothetical protein
MTTLTSNDASLLKYSIKNKKWIQNKNKFGRIISLIIGIPLMLFFLLLTGSLAFEKQDNMAGGVFMCFLICFLPGAWLFVTANLRLVIDFNAKAIYYALFNKKFKIIKGEQIRDVYIIDLTQQGRYKGYQYYFNYSNDKKPAVKKSSEVTMQDMIVNPTNAPMVKIKNIRITGDYKLRTEIEQVNYIMNQIILNLQP